MKQLINRHTLDHINFFFQSNQMRKKLILMYINRSCSDQYVRSERQVYSGDEGADGAGEG